MFHCFEPGESFSQLAIPQKISRPLPCLNQHGCPTPVGAPVVVHHSPHPCATMSLPPRRLARVVLRLIVALNERDLDW